MSKLLNQKDENHKEVVRQSIEALLENINQMSTIAMCQFELIDSIVPKIE